MISLQEYLDRKPESQNAIYYLCTPSREIALESPYYELFKKHNIEVLFLYDSVDEFVMNHLHNFKNVKLISIDSEEAVEAVSNVSDADSDTKYLTDAQAQELADWMLKALGTTVKTVKPSKRLVSHPAVVVDPESPTMRRKLPK
jgi:TNF receptor-associated protein 1